MRLCNRIHKDVSVKGLNVLTHIEKKKQMLSQQCPLIHYWLPWWVQMSQTMFGQEHLAPQQIILKKLSKLELRFFPRQLF